MSSKYRLYIGPPKKYSGAWKIPTWYSVNNTGDWAVGSEAAVLLGYHLDHTGSIQGFPVMYLAMYEKLCGARDWAQVQTYKACALILELSPQQPQFLLSF